MLPLLIRMMWHLRRGDTIYIKERGLLLRPKVVQSEMHRAEYQALTARLVDLMGRS